MAVVAELVGGPLCGRELAVPGEGPAVIVFHVAGGTLLRSHHPTAGTTLADARQVLYRRTGKRTQAGCEMYLYTRAP